MAGRLVTAIAGACIVALGCASFGVDGDSASNPSTDAGSDVATSVPTPDAAACPDKIDDDFGRTSLLGGPWQSAVGDPNRIKLLDGALSIETQAKQSEEQLTLTTGSLPPPRRLTCRFVFTKMTEFNSTSHSFPPPIDLFVLALTYPDGTKTLVRFSYSEQRLSVRDDHYDAQGTCVACPTNRTQAETPLAIAKSSPVELTLDVHDDEATFRRSGDAAMAQRAVTLGRPSSAQIFFGLWSYSDYSQQGQLDDLHCELDCN